MGSTVAVDSIVAGREVIAVVVGLVMNGGIVPVGGFCDVNKLDTVKGVDNGAGGVIEAVVKPGEDSP